MPRPCAKQCHVLAQGWSSPSFDITIGQALSKMSPHELSVQVSSEALNNSMVAEEPMAVIARQ